MARSSKTNAGQPAETPTSEEQGLVELPLDLTNLTLEELMGLPVRGSPRVAPESALAEGSGFADEGLEPMLEGLDVLPDDLTALGILELMNLRVRAPSPLEHQDEDNGHRVAGSPTQSTGSSFEAAELVALAQKALFEIFVAAQSEGGGPVIEGELAGDVPGPENFPASTDTAGTDNDAPGSADVAASTPPSESGGSGDDELPGGAGDDTPPPPANNAPTTDNVSASGNEDAASIAVTLTGSDIDGTVASFSLSSLPANGTLYTDSGLTTLAATGTDYAASGGSLTLYFVPNANYNGSTNFSFAAKDNSGTADPSPATATITVNAVNDAPTTDNVSASGNEDAASIAVTLTGSDIDGTVASFSLSSLPANGTLYTNAGLTTLAATGTDYAASGGSLTLYFVPNANYNGSTNFSFAAKDNSGTADPSPATATITVNAVNDAPTTDNVSASGNEDAASIAVTLTGSDIDGTVASFSLSSLPANGTLYTDSGLTTLATTGTDYAASGGSLTLYFVPDANYNGSTNFAFAAKDNSGTADPSPATATITVNAVNDAPTTDNVSASGNEDAASIAVTLTGSDIDGTVASFSLSSLPANGTLYTNAGLTTLAATGTDYAASGGSLTLYFVPNANYNGSTNFTFAAKDNSGTADPSPATATITVNAVNDAPTTDNVSASGNEDAASIAVTLTGSDIDGTVASFSLSSLPANGTLYTDSGLTTLAATGTDYAASGGSLTLYFVPNANYNGSTNFSFAAKDNSGTADPSPATATITVNAVNDAPTTDNVSASGNEDAASIAVTLTGSDIDGTVASYSLSSLPANGTLYTNAGLTTLATTGTDYAASGGSLTLYFVPNANYNGSTNFAFAAKDNSGTTDPSPATATITVNAVNDAPTTDNVSASGNEDAASIAVTLTGSDIDGTVASFSLSSLPANGTLYTDSGLTTLAATGTDYAASGGSLTLYFVPDANYNGSTNFSFAAKDNSGTADPSPATATITVNAVNDAPTTDNVSASGNEDAASIAVTLTGSDIDGTVASFSLSSLPANGTLYTDSGLTTLAATGTDYAASGDSLTLYFVPNANYNGSTNFSFAAKDNSGTADPSPATATITVNAVNDDPDGTDSVASMESGTAISGTLTASDVDNTAGQLSYSLATGASNGVAVVNADGTYTYTPNAGYVGSDSFTFTVTDPGLGSDTATVNVTVLSSGGSLNLSTGSEARVNSTTSNKQQDPAVANLSGGGYVVVWQHGADSEEEAGNVYAQRYDSSGNTVGSQITVGSYGGHDDNGVLFEADVTGLTGGGFVVTWQEDEEVLARIYDSSGNPSGSEFTVNTTTGNTQESPAIAATGDGGFVVVWDGNGSGDSSGVFGQRYNSSGSSVGSEFRVNTTTSNTQDDPNVAALNNGGFVVVWDGNGTGDSSGVFAQLYNSSGNTVGSEFRVNTTTSDTQSNASVTTLNNGDFLVVWQSDEQDGDDWGIYAQRFDSSGSTVGSEFRVNTTTSNDQTEPEVTALNDGGFMVVWESANQDGSQDGVYAKRYDADGSDLSGEIRVNTTTSNNQGSPDIDVLQDGSVIVTWDGNGPGDSNGIHSHLYSTDAPSGHTMTGGAGNDSFIGGSAGDTLTGAGGNDLLDGGGGADSLNGGAGDDILIWDSADTTIAGGTGADTLRVSSGNADLTAFGGTITGIETVDLATDTGANSLVLTAQDVLDISDTDVVTVDGTGADSVNAGTGWTDGGVSGGYHTYTKVIGADLATLLVDTDISVNADILT